MSGAGSYSTERVIEVARLLGELAEESVFVGGAAIGLLLTDPAIPDVRATLDVDIIVKVATRPGYYAFLERLRSKGFREDATSEIICRWRHGAIILDLMPTAIRQSVV